jgi:hypothetical protein
MLGYMMTENNQRNAPRQRVLKPARLISLDRKTVSDCTIKNISETGAQLKVQNQITVPREFLFLQPKLNLMCHARVVWRRDDLVGITFTTPMAEAPANLTSLKL